MVTAKVLGKIVQQESWQNSSRQRNNHRRRTPSLFLFGLGIFFLFTLKGAQAGWEILPDSHQQLYDTWGAFIDNQTTLVDMGKDRVWGALGGTVPLLANTESLHYPALLVQASGNFAIHYNPSGRLWTETLDARLAAIFEYEFTNKFRGLVAYIHFSGHTVDGLNTADSELIEPGVGQEFLQIRLIYDVAETLRLAADFKPVVRSYPYIKPIWFAQDIEYFPWGAKDQTHSFAPYIAFGLAQTGMDYYIVTYHAQIGVYVGNHFSPGHHQTARIVLGYYNGADPRLKYLELLDSTKKFGYFGVMFDL